MIRRAIALGLGVVIVIVIVLLINGCVKSEKQESLKSYNHEVSQLGSESVEQVATPLFETLASASSKKALEVDEDINQLNVKAHRQLELAQHLSVPGEMEGAQRDLLLALGLRVEGVEKLASLLQTALASKQKKAVEEIAGDMELFLASDVIYAERVVPLVQQALSANSINGLTTAPSRFLPNLGWLETSTVSSRLSGTSTQSTSTPTAGTHGSALISTSVAGNTLAPEPTLNHLSGGSEPTFTVTGEDSGESPETNVKVEVKVSQGGKEYKASSVVEKTEPGKKFTAEVTVKGVPTGVPAKVETNIVGVPGEANLENNKGSYLSISE